MGNLKEIRNRIDSITSTQQITSAMKMVSVSKLKKAQNAILGLRPYSGKLNEIIVRLLNDGVKSNEIWSQNKENPQKILIIAIASNRGLCGSFNMNVAKRIEALITNEYKEQYFNGNLQIITAGKRLESSLKFKNIRILESWNELSDNHNYDDFIEKVNQVLDSFENGTYEKIILLYNHFVNAIKQDLTEEQFLPIAQINVENQENSNKNHSVLPVTYIYEPSREEILKEMVPKMLKTKFYRSFLDSSEAEHGARMTAMHQASDNATELLKELKMNYNKARQMAITNELLEIVSGSIGLES